jgi:hypothetical protein
MTQNKQGHTALPWVAKGLYIMNESLDVDVAEVMELNYNANAAYIVQCVNSHALLVEALDNLMIQASMVNNLQHSGFTITKEMFGDLYDATNKARAALAQARGA